MTSLLPYEQFSSVAMEKCTYTARAHIHIDTSNGMANNHTNDIIFSGFHEVHTMNYTRLQLLELIDSIFLSLPHSMFFHTG